MGLRDYLNRKNRLGISNNNMWLGLIFAAGLGVSVYTADNENSKKQNEILQLPLVQLSGLVLEEKPIFDNPFIGKPDIVRYSFFMRDSSKGTIEVKVDNFHTGVWLEGYESKIVPTCKVTLNAREIGPNLYHAVASDSVYIECN